MPASSVPIDLSRPSRVAAADEVRRAAAGDMPCATSNENSSAFRPCGLTAESVPKATFTPMASARRKVADRAVTAAFALAAISGG